MALLRYLCLQPMALQKVSKTAMPLAIGISVPNAGFAAALTDVTAATLIARSLALLEEDTNVNQQINECVKEITNK